MIRACIHLGMYNHSVSQEILDKIYSYYTGGVKDTYCQKLSHHYGC